MSYFSVAPWQAAYLFRLGAAGLLVHFGVVTLTLLLLIAPGGAPGWPLAWYFAMLVLTGAAAALAASFVHRANPSERFVQRAALAHSALVSGIGLTWGAGAFIAATGSFQTLLVYSLALGGTALGAVSSQHSVPRSALLSIWTAVPLLALAHYHHDPGPSGVGNAAMIGFYGLTLSLLTRRMHGFLQHNTALNAQLDAKVAALTAATTAMQAARQEADAANLAKSRFLAQASHELRQPIHAISLFTACLADAQLGQDERAMVHNIDRSLHSVSGLFRSLLDVAALDVGKIEPRMQAFPIGATLLEVARQNQEQARQTGNTIRVVQTAEHVLADQDLLTTMLQNMVSNALKYAPGSRILLGCRRDGATLRVEIHDTGPGLADDETIRIFEEFYRAPPEPLQQVEGLGLGLPIVRRLGHLMGLEVTAASAQGRGSSFAISGLQRVAAPALPTTRTASAAGRSLAGLKVLLLDSEPDVLLATASIMRRWGCTVTASATLPAEPTGSDLIVMSFDLAPGLTALEVIPQLRANEGRALPALIITGHDASKIRALLPFSGIEILAKPVPGARLRAALRASRQALALRNL